MIRALSVFILLIACTMTVGVCMAAGAKSGEYPISVDNLTVPIISVIMICGSIIGGVAWIDQRIKSSLAPLAESVESLREETADIDRRVIHVEARINTLGCQRDEGCDLA